MHERVVFNLGKFKSRKCLISFSRDYVRKGQKNKKALKNQGFLWLYLFYSPFLVAGVGFVRSKATEQRSRRQASATTSGLSLRARPFTQSQRAQGQLASLLLVRWTSFVQNNTQLFWTPHPTSTARRSITRGRRRAKLTPWQKKKTHREGVFFFLVAGVGFFIALPSRIVVCRRLRLLGSAYSLLCGVSLAHPLPPPEVVVAIQNLASKERKKQTHPIGCLFFFLCYLDKIDA